jgi:hypothetical protein
MSSAYRIRPTGITHERIDGEVIAVNLLSGCYFSLVGVAAEVWGRLARASTGEEIARGVALRYGIDAERASGDVARFLAELEANGLVATASDDGPAAAAPDAAAAPPASPYEAPKLQAYSDLKDLLELDPIHEVGEDGWPGAPRG